MHLNWVDYTLLLIMLASVLMSLVRGFVREFLSLATWVVAYIIAGGFAEALAQRFNGYIASPQVYIVGAFTALFLLTLVVGMFVATLISRAVNISGLGLPDRLVGAIFGAGRGLLIVTVLTLILSATQLASKQAWQHSVVVARVSKLSHKVLQFMPDKVAHYFKQAQSSYLPKSNTNGQNATSNLPSEDN